MVKLTSNKKLEWSKEVGVSFDKVKKNLLCSAFILTYLIFGDNEGKFILDVDASGESVSAVLSQNQEEQERM